MRACRLSLRGGAVLRHGQRERAALARSTLQLDPAAMSLHDVLDDGKPQSRAIARPGEAVIDPIELLEDSLVFDLRDPRPDSGLSGGSLRWSGFALAGRAGLC